jgi:hypothetical protein
MKRADVEKIIDEEAPKIGVPADVYKAIVFRGENSAHKDDIPTNLVNTASKASGIAQVMPHVWDSLKKQGRVKAEADLFDARENLIAGMHIFKEGIVMNKGNVRAGVAHFNGGTAIGRKVAAGEDPGNKETRDYLQRVFPMDGTSTPGSSPATPAVNVATAGQPPAGGTSVPMDTKSSSSTRFSGRFVANAEQLQASLSTYLANAAASTNELLRLTTEGTAAGNVMADTAVEMGKVQSSGIRSAGEIAARNNEKQRQAVDVFGAGLDDPAGMMIQAIKQQTEARAAVDMLRPKIAEEMAVQAWDDPMRWLVNKFTLPGMIQAHNLANNVDRQMTARIQQTQQVVQAQQQIDIAPTANLIREQAAAQAQEASYKALMLASKAKQETAHMGAQAVLQKMSMGSAALNAQTDIAKLFAQSYSIGASEREDAALSPTVNRVNLKRVSLGLEPYSLEEFKMLTPKERGELTANSKVPQLGVSPGDSIRFIDSQGATGTLREKDPAVHKFLNNWFALPGFKEQLTLIQMNTKHANLPLMEQRAMAADNLAQIYATEEQNRPKNGNNKFSDGNPYKLKLLNAATDPMLAKNPFSQAVLQQQSASPAPVTDDFVAAQAIGMAAADRSKIPEIAKQFSEFYNIGIYNQWANAGAMRLGFPRPHGYALSSVYTTATGKALDTGSPAAVEHWINMNLQAQTRAKEAAILDPMGTSQIAPYFAP